MEQKHLPQPSSGFRKFRAVLDGYVHAIGSAGVATGVVAGVASLFSQRTFPQIARGVWTGGSGVVLGLFTLGIGTLNAVINYAELKLRDKHIQKLAEENIAMRNHLGQAGAMLNQMAAHIEKSALAEKPSFADREKPPVATHADAAIADKQAAADATPTMH